MGAAPGNALAEPALHDGAARGIDRLDSSDRAPRHRQAGNAGEDKDQHDAGGERDVDPPYERIEIGDVTADQQMCAIRQSDQNSAHLRSRTRLAPQWLET